MDKNAKKGRDRFQRKRKAVKNAGLYEDAKQHARENRDDGKAYVREQDLDAVIDKNNLRVSTGHSSGLGSSTSSSKGWSSPYGYPNSISSN